MFIRKLMAHELKQASILHRYSQSSGWSDSEPSEDDLSFYTVDEMLGAFEENKLVSIIRNFSFRQLIRGVVKQMGGVSHVATYPEDRLKGYIRELTKAAFLDMKEKKQSVSMLHPFKESFYEQYSYVSANDNVIIKIPLNGFAHYLKIEDKQNVIWDEVRVKAVSVKEEFESFKLESASSYHHGLVLLNDVSDEYWVQDHEDVIVIFIKKDNKTVAAAKYMKWGSRETGQITVPEMYWSSIESRERLFRYFAKHIDQVAFVELRVAIGMNFYNWIKDSKPFEVKMDYNPWMVRIIDVMEAFKGIRTNYNGEVIFTLHDDFCEWNNGTFELKAVNNQLVCCHVSAQQVYATIDIRGLSALLYGVCSVEELLFRSWINIEDDTTKKTLEAWFPVIPLYNPYYY